MAYPKTEISDEAADEIERFKKRCIRQKSENTGKRYASATRQFVAWLEDKGLSLNDVESRDVEDYIYHLQDEGYADDTVKVHRSGILAFYDEMRDENPARDVDFGKGQWSTTTDKEKATRQEVEYLEEDQVRELIEHVPEPSTRNKLILRLLYSTGIRVGELTNIRLDDVDYGQRTIEIHTQKSDSYRTVVYPSGLSTLMTIWRDSLRASQLYAEDSPYLFPTDSSEQISVETIGGIVRKAAERADIQEVYGQDARGGEQHKVTAHTLRHSFAVNAIKQEPPMPLPLLKEALGHSDIDITQVYLDVAQKDVEDAYRAYGPSL
ncbi:tyrosine-type recombinase/integrase [Haloarcula japonica]|uniref:tyrosine-type recombinase/integrase n=1 Tax=Haloarcula japonica TaxID=29282 RepID=UPI0039F66E17